MGSGSGVMGKFVMIEISFGNDHGGIAVVLSISIGHFWK